MVKPKYKKGMDLSQLARSIVEYATGGPLTANKDKTIPSLLTPRKKRPQLKKQQE
jgi:hypothetical protein